jgi:hypothetical protein
MAGDQSEGIGRIVQVRPTDVRGAGATKCRCLKVLSKVSKMSRSVLIFGRQLGRLSDCPVAIGKSGGPSDTPDTLDKASNHRIF